MVKIKLAPTVVVSLSLVLGLLIFLSPASASLIAPKNKCSGQTEEIMSNSAKNLKRANKAMLCLHNYAREKKGLRPLKSNKKLFKSSARKVNDIDKCKQFSHEACNYKFDHWIRKYYYNKNKAAEWAENLVIGERGLGSPRSLFIAWMNSPGHRSNILYKNYRDLGLSVKIVNGVNDNNGGKRYTLNNASLWVAHFGRTY